MINEIKISLMETENPMGENEVIGKSDYIVKSTAQFKPKEYWEKHYRDKTPHDKANIELFDNFLSTSLDMIYKDLLRQTNQKVDSVGIWVDTGDKQLEMSMTIEGLDAMEKYHTGDDELIPIFEMLQMAVLQTEDE